MKLQFFDPCPYKNDYVSRMYLAPMRAFARANGIEVRDIPALIPEPGWGTVCNADYLVTDRITEHRKAGSPIFVISCIDSAWISEALRYEPQSEFVNRIFMVTGVQNTNTSNAVEIDGQFNITTSPRTFLPEDAWQRFDRMRQSGQLKSLPYVPWVGMPILRKSFEERRETVMFRGGSHFFRVLAFFHALKNKCADPRSGFLTGYYFQDGMNPQFRYCDQCRVTYKEHHGYFPFALDGRNGCTSPAEWGEELSFANPSLWNNRCPASYYWLYDQFEKAHGGMGGQVDRAMQVTKAFNYRPDGIDEHIHAISEARFYAETKWEFSINMPQRFWEAAAAGTINLLPRRANDQDYFPILKDGEHFLTFSDDFSDINAKITKEDFERISGNTRAVFEQWIKPTDYAISTGLLKHIFEEIKSCKP